MILTELKKLAPILEAAVLAVDAQYLVTIPDNCSENSIAIIQRTLNEAGLLCVVVPEGMKFYHLSPEVPLTPKWRILCYPYGSNVGSEFHDAGQFDSEEVANAWISSQKPSQGSYEARPVE